MKKQEQQDAVEFMKQLAVVFAGIGAIAYAVFKVSSDVAVLTEQGKKVKKNLKKSYEHGKEAQAAIEDRA